MEDDITTLDDSIPRQQPVTTGTAPKSIAPEYEGLPEETVAELKAIADDIRAAIVASIAADLGYSEPTIAALIGHKGQTITSRYLHTADAVLLAAADAVADETARLMGETKRSLPLSSVVA